MSRFSTVSLSLLAASALLAGCDRESATDAQPDQAEAVAEVPSNPDAISREFAGQSLPEFTASAPDGTTLDLARLEGQPVLLNLWATWCAPCKAEMPILDAIAVENDGELRVVTVSQDTKGAEVVMPFFEEYSFAKLEPWLDTKSDLSFNMRVGDMPTTFLYNAEGLEVARVTGAFDWEGEEARALIAETIGG